MNKFIVLCIILFKANNNKLGECWAQSDKIWVNFILMQFLTVCVWKSEINMFYKCKNICFWIKILMSIYKYFPNFQLASIFCALSPGAICSENNKTKESPTLI